MGFPEAYEALGKMQGTIQQQEAAAVVHALQAVNDTIRHADGSISFIGNFVNQNLARLQNSADSTVKALENFNTTTQGFKSSLDELNENFAEFNRSTTNLGNTANFLTYGLLFFAAVQAFAMLMEAFPNFLSNIWGVFLFSLRLIF